MGKKKIKPKRIGILTAGGDCPGLNAVIRAVTKKAIFEYGMEVFGIEDGYAGLLQKRMYQLTTEDVSGILTQGGTILGTSNKANPYRVAFKSKGKLVFKDLSKKVIKYLKESKIDCLVCIGGDGTLNIAQRLCADGINVIGVPKTIDNDLLGTEITFGFDTAVQIVTEGVDRIHTTAQSHHRVMIIEVMGRKTGWIALYGGVAGGADVILIPEIPYKIEKVIQTVKHRSRHGKRFTIIVIAEGAKPVGGDVVIKKIVQDSTDPIRLGGVGFVLAEQIEKITGIETRTVVMGHLQRGGSPTAFDRVLATKLGAFAVNLIVENKFGNMVGVQCGKCVSVPLSEVAKGIKYVPLNHSLIMSARAVGTCFGD